MIFDRYIIYIYNIYIIYIIYIYVYYTYSFLYITHLCHINRLVGFLFTKGFEPKFCGPRFNFSYGKTGTPRWRLWCNGFKPRFHGLKLRPIRKITPGPWDFHPFKRSFIFQSFIFGFQPLVFGGVSKKVNLNWTFVVVERCPLVFFFTLGYVFFPLPGNSGFGSSHLKIRKKSRNKSCGVLLLLWRLTTPFFYICFKND